MSNYAFVERNDVEYPHTALKEVSFENKWLLIRPDGYIKVKGSHGQGYAWDGCSPKYYCWDILLGTPDGVVDCETGKPVTYYASLVHDALYQFREGYKDKITQKKVDELFFTELNKANFKLGLLYYLMARLFGGLYWNDYMKRNKKLKYIYPLLAGFLVWKICRKVTSVFCR
ncbi:hypothetical protein AAG747_14475 [Rapidithrix thailandica]|uniref:DUF1353 domain-containing protein n=1 Tax=Rapidithrix thailandica TaxID=413964 RepID=A0AAW9SBG9_9BACT